MNSQEFKYDVAFSFLQQDEPLAMELNDRLQDRVKTFIYSEQQKEIAGKDGEEGFNKVFGEEARIVVVLYRAGWGESRWTRIEQTAIRNRGHEHGYRFAKFIPLDEPPTVPKWLPATQIWIGLKRHGLDGAAAVIEARVQDVGGTIHEETIEERAKRLERNIQFRDRREKFQWDQGVQAARIEVEKLKQPLESKAATVKKSSSIDLNVIQNWGTMYLIGLGRALGVHWKLEASNHLRGAFLDVRLFSHQPAGPGQLEFEKPHVVQSMRFTFDLLPSDVGGWISGDAQKRTFSTETLADYLTKFYLDNGRKD
ncbi:MAG TPA: hypothetical protein VEP70_05610 [Burkholderiales bacterium]|nr:hypothetical protein [Burkholderiales bacterium]